MEGNTNKLYEDEKFIEFLREFLPDNFIYQDPIRKRKMVRELEKYLSIIQERESIGIEFIDGRHTFAAHDMEKDMIILNNIMLNNPFSIVDALLHEGYHHITNFNHKYPGRFSEEEIEFYNLNAFKSKIDGTTACYINYREDLDNYIIQPSEYSSYKEALFTGKELFSFMEKKFNKKGLVKSYLNDSHFKEDFFSKKKYEEEIYPAQKILVEGFRETVREDEENYKKIKAIVDNTLSKVQNLQEASPELLNDLFFPLCWHQLDLAKRSEVYEAFIKSNSLSARAPTEDLLSNDSIYVLEQILIDNTNYLLEKETGRRLDYIGDLKYFNPFYNGKININKLYKSNKDKDINSFYPLNKLDTAFFMFPKFQIVKESYILDALNFFSRLDEVFTSGRRKHRILQSNIGAFKKLLHDSLIFEEKRDEFIGKFSKNKVR